MALNHVGPLCHAKIKVHDTPVKLTLKTDNQDLYFNSFRQQKI
jgi:hypothetical protein